MPEQNYVDPVIQRLDQAERKILNQIDQIDQNGQATLAQAAAARLEPDPTMSPVMNRIDNLEHTVVARLAQIGQTQTAPTPIVESIAVQAAAQEAPRPKKLYTRDSAPQAPKRENAPRETPQWQKNLTDIEWLTSRLGIGLLVIGVVTLLFWLNDQPWVTNGLRLGAGYGIGAMLLGLGLTLTKNRPSFGQVLSGGGIAIFYLSTYIGNQTFELIPDIATLPIIFAITVIAYGLAAWQKRQPLAYVGLILGLLVPPFVAPDDPSAAIFAGYVTIVLVGAVAIYQRLNWRWLMFSAFGIGWIYMFALTIMAVESNIDGPQLIDQLSVQAAILVSLLAFGIFPLLQQLYARRGLEPAALAPYTITENDKEKVINPHPVHWTNFLYIATSPILAILLILPLWPDIGVGLWTTITVLGAVLYMAAGFMLGRNPRFEIFQVPLFLVGAILLPMSLLKFDGDIAAPLLITLSVEAAGLAVFSQRRNLKWMMAATHLLFVWSLFLWLGGIVDDQVDPVFFNLNFLASSVFVLALVITAWVQSAGISKIIYQGMAHLIALPVTGVELSRLFDGETYWLLLHTIIHAAVFAIGHLRDNKWLRYQAVAFIGLAMLVQAGLDADGELTWPNIMLAFAALQILAVNVVAKQLDDQFLSIEGVLLTGVGAITMFIRMISMGEDFTPFVGPAALAGLVMMVVLLLIDLRFSNKPFDTIIGIGTHLLALMWIAFQVQNFDYALGLISGIWALYAIGLLIAGMVFDRPLMRQLGIGTILLTIAKLILVDLENVSTGVRVILFSGFGGVLLAISYFSRKLWRKPEDETIENEPVLTSSDK